MKTTFAEFVKKVLEILPEATFSEDADGQIVVHTDLKNFTENGKEIVIPLDTQVEFNPKNGKWELL